MADTVSKKRRSEIMANIRGKDTSIEILVRKHLFSKGFRYRKNVRSLPGKPDIVLPKYRTLILINGCFWHGHEPCKSYSFPKSRIEFWTEKISKNKDRDRKNIAALTDLGWKVITIWQCEIKGKSLHEKLRWLENEIKGKQPV